MVPSRPSRAPQGFKKSRDVKRRAKDLDQIQDEVKAGVVVHAVDPDLPGLGQSYCVTCARHFMDRDNLDKHCRTKPHRRRLKLVAEEQYTQEEADRGAGMGAPDNGPPVSIRDAAKSAVAAVPSLVAALSSSVRAPPADANAADTVMR